MTEYAMKAIIKNDLPKRKIIEIEKELRQDMGRELIKMMEDGKYYRIRLNTMQDENRIRYHGTFDYIITAEIEDYA